MKPSDIVKEELYGPSGIKILGTIIVYMIAGLGMLAMILWLGIVLKSFVLACIAFIVGGVVFGKLLNEAYYLIYPDKRPKGPRTRAEKRELDEKCRIVHEEIVREEEREEEREREKSTKKEKKRE